MFDRLARALNRIHFLSISRNVVRNLSLYVLLFDMTEYFSNERNLTFFSATACMTTKAMGQNAVETSE